MRIQRDIYQEDRLSSLLFVITMMPFNYIFRKYTGSNKLTKLDKIERPNRERIRTLGEKENLQFIANTGNIHNQTSCDEKKKKEEKSTSDE